MTSLNVKYYTAFQVLVNLHDIYILTWFLIVIVRVFQNIPAIKIAIGDRKYTSVPYRLKRGVMIVLFVCLFWGFLPNREFFTHIETSPLQ